MIETNELSKNARGGTELMVDALSKLIDQDLLEKFQIIPSRVRTLMTDRKRILWLHDLAGDPEAEHLKFEESRDQFDGLVFVSHWQQQMFNLYLGVPYTKGTVLQNAIVPIPEHEKPNDGTIRLIYHTTPHRGLGLLVPVFDHLYHLFKNQGIDIQLDVYSSFSVYGWPERDEPYKGLFQDCIDHPGIVYHGAVSNSEIREALQKSDIFAYPCVWQETSCIAAIEALSAKNVVVCPNYAALPETCANFAYMYQWTENAQEHANRFAQTLANAISVVNKAKQTDDVSFQNRMFFQREYFSMFYSWDYRAHQWTQYLKQKAA